MNYSDFAPLCSLRSVLPSTSNSDAQNFIIQIYIKKIEKSNVFEINLHFYEFFSNLWLTCSLNGEHDGKFSIFRYPDIMLPNL